MDHLNASFFAIKKINKFFYRIIFNNKTGETILISRYDNLHESFGMDDIYLNENKNKRGDVDILFGINTLPDNLDINKTYHIDNFNKNKNIMSICLGDYSIPIYVFKNKISLNITSNIFSPTIYGHISRTIFNKFNKSTTIFNTYPNNNFKLVDAKNEIFYMNSFIDKNKILDKTSEKTLLQIGDACYYIPKFYRNILYTNFVYDDILDSHIEMMDINYDEIWTTSEFGTNLLKKITKQKIKTVRPGIKTSIFKKENISEYLINKVKEEFSDFHEKFKFISICQDTFRSGIEIIIESFFNVFKNNNNAILCLFIEPIGDLQAIHKRDRIKHYSKMIKSINNKLNIKKQPLIYLEYGPLSQQKKSILLSISDCHILASRGEGCCLPLIESALCDLPQIIPNHTGLTELYPSSMTEFIPTFKSNCGLKKINISEDNFKYIGDYPQLDDSPDFSPIHFSSTMYDYDENSINWISQRMISEYNNKNTEYHQHNIPLLKEKIKELYDEDIFFDNLKKNLPEIEF